jgi:hypothetical protein
VALLSVEDQESGTLCGRCRRGVGEARTAPILAASGKLMSSACSFHGFISKVTSLRASGKERRLGFEFEETIMVRIFHNMVCVCVCVC